MKLRLTIIVSSHILDTLVNFCDEIMIMKNGSIDKIVRAENVVELEREIFERDH